MARPAVDNTPQVWKFLRGKGLTPAQAAGVIGSMQGESGPGLDPAAVNPNGGATGIAQWLGGRKTAAVLTKQLGPQLNHLWGELQGPESAALKAIKAAHTPEQAAIAWQRVFERGAPFEQKYNQRAANARKVFNRLRGVGGNPNAAAGGRPRDTPGTPGSSRTTTTTTPGVDNSQQRAMVALNFLGNKNADVLDFASQIKQLQDIPGTTESKAVTTPGSSGSGSPDAPSSNTGPNPGKFGKSHSPLLELIHKGGPGYAVKNGKKVDGAQFYASVWDGHADHVHVAAGPKTIVQLGKIAQQMGLHVGENPHFGSVNPVHSPNSYHYKGEAIDVSGDPGKMNAYAAKVERLYGLKR